MMRIKRLMRCISYKKDSLVSVTLSSLAASLANPTKWQKHRGISSWSATIMSSIRGKVNLFTRRWTTRKALPWNETIYIMWYLRSSQISSSRLVRKHLIITSTGSTNPLQLKDVKSLKRLIRLDSYSTSSTLTTQHRSVRRYHPYKNTETSQCSNSNFDYKNEMNLLIDNRKRIRSSLNLELVNKLRINNNKPSKPIQKNLRYPVFRSKRKKIRYQRPYKRTMCHQLAVLVSPRS